MITSNCDGKAQQGNHVFWLVTWTNKSYYDDYVGKDYPLPEDANIWVTIAPELKNFIQK